MRSIVVLTTVAEYDLLEHDVTTDLLQKFYGKPRAEWDEALLDAGQSEAVKHAVVKSAATRTIEIDREEDIVYVTYAVSVEIDCDTGTMDYFGTSVDEIVRDGCHVDFPIDQDLVEMVSEDTKTSSIPAG